MAVMLQAFYQVGRSGVPCPMDGGPTSVWWWDHLAAEAKLLRKACFTALWLPPVNKGALGLRSVGYDVFDDYDLGSKDQRGAIPTRYGSREQLQRCVAMCRANGLEVYLDLVENQRSAGAGPPCFPIYYKDAFGNPRGGRFEKDALCFHPNVPEDPNVFGTPRIPEVSFGLDLAPINGQPPRQVFDGLVDSADWVTRALDVQGYRIDDVKGISTDFLLPFLDSKSMAGKFAVGEFFDGDLELLRHWVFDSRGMRGRTSAFDFPTRFKLAEMCNRLVSFDMASLDHAGLAGSDPFSAVTFVENHDTDTSPSLEPIVRNKALAYAYILTSEGYPCVFYKDYSVDEGCYGMKDVIDNLMWIHEHLAEGPTQERWKDRDVFAYERLGGPHLLVGLNNDAQQARTVSVASDFGPGVCLHDYCGHGRDLLTDGTGRFTLTIPPNVDGMGYVAYSRVGIAGETLVIPRSVTQVFEGAKDLDTLPAMEGRELQVCRVWCRANTAISATLHINVARWCPVTCLTLKLHSPTDAVIVATQYRHAEEAELGLCAIAVVTGYYSFHVQLSGTAFDAAEQPYSLSVAYQAPQCFEVEHPVTT
jgi:alpha-amylase